MNVVGTGRGPTIRFRVAVTAGRLAAEVSRRLGCGGGSVIGGRVAHRLCPDVLTRLAAGRTSVLVTGTNGKTTTSHLVAAALRDRGPVAHNASGSNMLDGAVGALMATPRSRLCVLEVDELHLGPVLDAVRPAVLVLLNLSRDQLDRVSEVRQTARTVESVLARHPDTVVVANADDPLVVSAAGSSPHVVWVAAGAGWEADTRTCPTCGHQVSRRTNGLRAVSWWCDHCGLHRPCPAWWWTPADEPGGFVVHHRDVAAVTVVSGLPGRVNRSNTTIALAAADAVGTDPASAAPHVARVRSVAGRYDRVAWEDRLVRSVLVKNPAGWGEALDVLAGARPVLLVVNAREADGRDVSWLWDLPVDVLRGRVVAVAGERAADLGVRLSYAGIPHHSHPDPLVALAALPAGEVDAVANYTAFRDLRRSLAGPARPRRPGGGTGHPRPAPEVPPPGPPGPAEPAGPDSGRRRCAPTVP
ncbi:MurT ligase domain-containing protein [Actinomycetospora endophytica]|uniref:Lipid II isoglutaminyl synthase (glutamine-hydrolyzing) subunit MurT n=1 Tax=Actinomycetospora endophytica TaxID=2291215 RepID=A0ABS8PA94_9PSEU|nr:MurT ligase domain-containing protein [Actinomycetospora endophytica]MCD2195203.1 MurT ligase domain-containing protein [Actinomycetospora endophytica]